MIKKYLNLEYQEEDGLNNVVSFRNLLFENLQQDNLEIPNEDLDKLTSILGSFDSQKLLSEKLIEFGTNLTGFDARLDQENGDIVSIEMPTNLLLMTTYYEFNFTDIPQSYMNLQTEYYKRPCIYCDKVKVENITCLLTNKTICMHNINRKTGAVDQCRLGSKMHQNPGEGLMCWHTKVCEGGCGLFLKTSTGTIFMVYDGNVGTYDSPYRNKYGEMIEKYSKDYDKFNIDQQGGGEESLK